MARKKLSEFKAKSLLFASLDIPYAGVPITSSDVSGIKHLDQKKTYVVKVDQGIKGRMKKGLVGLNLLPNQILAKIKEFQSKGYSQFLVEEFFPHQQTSERYFSIERTRSGNVIYFASVGGIDIESNQEKIRKEIISPKNMENIAEFLGLPTEDFEKIILFFEKQFISFLEVNPLVVENNACYFLDLAVEVDSAAEFFVQDSWSAKDFVESSNQVKTEEEKNIMALQANS